MEGSLKIGLVQAYWGDGKGKTTAALGTALRACGNGFSVFLIQFMKNGAESLDQQIPGEILALEKFENFKYKKFGIGGWIKGKPTEEQKESCKKALRFLEEVMSSGKVDMVIADEILYAVQLGLIDECEVVDLIEGKPKGMELILTGSHILLEKIFEKVDLLTNVKKMKHPYDFGIMARKGVDF